MLFDSQKDVISGKQCEFWQYFRFSGGKSRFHLNTYNFKRLFRERLSLSTKRRTSGYNFSKLQSYFWEKEPSNPLKLCHFMNAALPQKHLKIYNLTRANAGLMKLTTIMCLDRTFNLEENWGVNQKRLKLSQKNNFWVNFRCFLRKK